MSNLLDAILGTFNSGQSGGFIPGRMLRDAPNSGYLPEDQVSTPPTDPYGNRVGGPAPGVPLPRPRPTEAGPAAFSPAMTPPEMQPGESGGSAPGFRSGGGLAAALGLDPDKAKTVMASLAGGLAHVKNSPFAGQVAANAAGGALAGGNKAEDTAIEQAIKLQRARQIGFKRADAASARWYRDRVAALRDEQRAINQSAQTPEQKAAQYKSLQDRARALAVEFQNIKAQNCRAHGLSNDGTPLPQVGETAAPESNAPESPGASVH
jgi:hypothetical protein